MWRSPLYLDKYQYVKTNPLFIRAIGLAGVFATLLIGIGFFNYLKINIFYAIFFGPILAVFVTNKFLRFFIQLFYQRLDPKKHEAFVNKFWRENEEPSVNVFLPWAGEDLTMHEEVVHAVSLLDYKNVKVYMLDDVGSIEHKALAEKYGFNYLSRPNKGLYKKSGNLEYGYRHSDGEFVLILDADFIPIKEFLRDLVPYIAKDPEIGILQTPQYFEQTDEVHKRSKIEFGGGNIVEDFYKIIMPCRDEFKAAMCVGTSAIYRREAILKLNGTPKVHASEDLATGLLITRFGYYVKYLPLIMSMGKSPETYQGYFKQHLRWCSGNLVFARYWPKAKLSVLARLIYMINPMYYISEAFSVIMSFQFLILIYFHSDTLSIYHSLYFLPYIILTRLIDPLTKTNKNKIGTKLAALNNSYTYFYTYIRMATKGVPSWHPSGVKLQGLHEDFISAHNIGTFISSMFIICMIFVFMAKPQIFSNFNAYIVIGWTFYSLMWHVLYLSHVAEFVHPYRASLAQNYYAKAFAFAEKRATLFLFGVLVGTSVFNFYRYSADLKTPIVSKIDEVKIRQKRNGEMLTPLASASFKPIEKVIIESKTTSPSAVLKEEYSFKVEKGNNLIKLAGDAVASISSAFEIPLTENQVGYAAATIVNKSPSQENLKPGEIVSFNSEMIVDSVGEAVERIDEVPVGINSDDLKGTEQLINVSPTPTVVKVNPTPITEVIN